MENSITEVSQCYDKLRLRLNHRLPLTDEIKRMAKCSICSGCGLYVCDLHWTTLMVSCYTDVGYLTDADDLKSQTGYVFILNGGAVDWKSAKQSIFATSSAEAEYIAAFDASKEAVWVRKFIYGLGVVPTLKKPIICI
ncbi:hypothetical protein Tco_0139713 [Tanacetum coccineum]